MFALGNILEIDLSRKTYRFRPYPHRSVTRFLTGRGFNVGYLFEHLKKGIDPLDRRNTLLFSCGLLTGQAAPASTRLHVNARSPLTGLLGSANVGGDFGLWLRSAGIQSLIIHGASPRPVSLLIEAEQVTFEDATALWGLDTWRSRERLEQNYGRKQSRSLVIGPAGENGVLFACIMSGKDHAAGRTGMGTVMGAKRLKAIVVRSRRSKAPAASEALRRAAASYTQKISASPAYKIFKAHGGAGYTRWANDLGIMATHNYRQNRFAGIARIDGRLLKPYQVKSTGCRRCPVQCKAELNFHDDANDGSRLTRPEFEPMINLGSKCGLDDLKMLVRIDKRCSQLGLDNISTGGVIAFAMDLYERGVLTKSACTGLELTWGNAGAMQTLIEQIAYRQHLGALLSQGVKKAAVVIGGGAERYAPHVKGLELAAYHPRAIVGSALGYAVASRGGDYSSVYAAMEYNWSPEKATVEFGTPAAVELKSTHGKAPLIKRAMVVNAVLDCLGICKVPSLSMIGTFDLKDETDLAAAVSGLHHSPDQLWAVGERIIHMERLINLRCGATAADDRLPEMFFNGAYSAGQPLEDAEENMTALCARFYGEMGWDSRGVPTIAQRKALQSDLLLFQSRQRPATRRRKPS